MIINQLKIKDVLNNLLCLENLEEIKNSIKEIKTCKINNLNLNRWKEYAKQNSFGNTI